MEIMKTYPDPVESAIVAALQALYRQSGRPIRCLQTGGPEDMKKLRRARFGFDLAVKPLAFTVNFWKWSWRWGK